MGDDKNDDEYNKLLSGGGIGGGLNIPKDLSGADAIKHDEDAIDFEDEDELAEDDLPEEEELPPDREIEAGGGEGEEEDDDSGFPPELKEVKSEPEEQYPAAQASPQEDIGMPMAGSMFDDDDEDWSKDFTDAGFRLIRDDDEHEGVEMSPMDFLMNRNNQASMPPPPVVRAANVIRPGQSAPVPMAHQDEAEYEPEEEEEEEEPVDKTIDEGTTEEQMLRKYYPEFRHGAVLKMNALFGPKPTKIALPKPKLARQCAPTRTGLEVEVDQKTMFKTNMERMTSAKNNIIRVSKDWNAGHSRTGNLGDDKQIDRDLVIASAEWDVPELWRDDDDGLESSDENELSLPLRRQQSRQTQEVKRPRAALEEIYNSEDEEDLLNDNFKPKKRVKLDLNDPHLLFIDQQRRQQAIQRTSQVPATERQLLQRYNISNDRAYDMLKENYQSKVRSTIGNLTIDHSMVALRLQSPHYKVKLSKAQMRSHHRPAFVVKPNTTIQFSKVKQRKRKKDKGKHITQLLRKTSDLTLGDSAGFFMLEYSEEFPLVLSNFGMGSKLINYYRKKSVDDTSRPKLPVGETHVLSVQDRSAFWNFGFVEPGNVVPTLYNRMIRAPIFKHEPSSTDFLLVRTTGGNSGQKYFLRTIPQLFVVGQTFPVSTIPGPHSRKVTTASKNRLKMVVYRVLNQNPRHRLLVKDISSHFPDQNDMQNRQRLKEFMEYQRSGDDQGFWKVKASEPLPNEESIRAMITPEDITMLEAMQVGQQHLEDAGYGKTVEDDDNNEDEDGQSIEEQLAPWNITRNFINATQGKAMLQLHGDGDPSGRGEAFSFLRTSMKGGFKAVGESVNERLDKSKFGGHSYNVAHQQKAYDEEIARIWYTQKKSLESTNTDDLGWDEAERKRDGVDRIREVDTPGPEDEGVSMFSQDSMSNNQRSKKVLRITRFFIDKNGTRQRKVEIVKDPNVIRAYVKRRQKIEDDMRAQSLASSSVDNFDDKLKAENMGPSNDADQNKRNQRLLKGELARLQRNQDRRNARKAQKVNNDPTAPQSGKGIGKGKSTTRKCATCGAVGHIRTNKSCPLYNERFGGSDNPAMPPPPSRP